MKFQQIYGQTGLKKRLIEEVRQGKIPHARMFVGKMGFGTLDLAQAYLQFIYCENKQENDSCGDCASCSKVSQNIHPDIHFSIPSVQAIAKDSDGFMKEWREILSQNKPFDLNDWIEQIDPKSMRKPILGTEEGNRINRVLSLKSYEGGYKTVLIWLPEEMNTTCANNILKILEEPQPKTLFLLVSENNDSILPTILSRTQMLSVGPLSMDDLVNSLKSKGLSLSQSESLAARADGDLLAALSLIHDVDELDKKREQFIQMMRVCFKKDVNAMLDWVESVSELSREGQKQFTLYALHMIRQSILKNYTDNILTRASEEEKAFLTNFSKFITNNNLFDFIQMFDDSYYHLERNANGKLLFTQLCFQVMRFIHKA